MKSAPIRNSHTTQTKRKDIAMVSKRSGAELEQRHHQVIDDLIAPEHRDSLKELVTKEGPHQTAIVNLLDNLLIMRFAFEVTQQNVDAGGFICSSCNLLRKG